MDRVAEINDLLDEAAEMPLGPARVAVSERAVSLADEHGDDDLRFGARLELLTSATFAGMPERSLTAFAWLLGKADAQPERFDVEQLLFPYRWIVEDAPYLLSVSAERVDALIDDMGERYARHWWWEHPVWEARMRWAIVRGAPAEEVERLYRGWRREFSRSGNRRSGHELHAAVIALTYLGRWEEAVSEARPSIEGQIPAEEEYPARTFAALLEPAAHLALPERAVWRDRAARLCTGNKVFIREVARLVTEYRRQGDEVPPFLVDDLERWVEESYDDHGIMFASAALAQVSRQRDRERHTELARALAARFDARHGNDATSTAIESLVG